jgi:hypothetical protein
VKRSRLARDLYELLTDLDLNEVVLLGHFDGIVSDLVLFRLVRPGAPVEDYLGRSIAISHFGPALDSTGISRFGRYLYRSASVRQSCRLTEQGSRTGNPKNHR